MTKTLTLLFLLATPTTALAGHGESCQHGSSDHESHEKSERGHRSGGSGYKMHEMVFRMIAENGEELSLRLIELLGRLYQRTGRTPQAEALFELDLRLIAQKALRLICTFLQARTLQ